MESIAYGGWARNARLVCGDVEMVVTLDVGPRIIRFGLIGGPNELKNFEQDLGSTDTSTFHSYGGHRLWIGPEEDPKTFTPDGFPVEYAEEDGWHVFTAAEEPWHVRKEMRIRPEPDDGRFLIEHRIYNEGAYTIEFAPWSITVVEVGGECVFPQHPFVDHSERVLPVRPLVLWGYTKMDDPRFTWGEHVVRLRQQARPATKIGALVQQGYAAYCNHGNVFLKRFGYEEGGLYPDFECNFETYTREDMLEVESLSPMQWVTPGAYASHLEAWYLIPGETPPKGDAECGRWLEQLAANRPL